MYRPIHTAVILCLLVLLAVGCKSNDEKTANNQTTMEGPPSNGEASACYVANVANSWRAWIDSMPGQDSEAKLHLTGQIRVASDKCEPQLTFVETRNDGKLLILRLGFVGEDQMEHGAQHAEDLRQDAEEMQRDAERQDAEDMQQDAEDMQQDAEDMEQQSDGLQGLGASREVRFESAEYTNVQTIEIRLPNGRTHRIEQIEQSQ